MALSPCGLKAEDCDDTIETLIAKEAIKQHVSVDLALAVAKIESGLNPMAVGKKGEIGLFQVMPYHYSLVHGKTKDAIKDTIKTRYDALHDIRTNIRIGISLLKKMSIQCADMGPYWVICYNQGLKKRPKHPFEHPYYRKIYNVLH